MGQQSDRSWSFFSLTDSVYVALEGESEENSVPPNGGRIIVPKRFEYLFGYVGGKSAYRDWTRECGCDIFESVLKKIRALGGQAMVWGDGNALLYVKMIPRRRITVWVENCIRFSSKDYDSEAFFTNLRRAQEAIWSRGKLAKVGLLL